MILIKKWEPTGLLDDMESVMDMNYVANYIEEMAQNLLKNQKENDSNMNNLMLPIVRRVYDDGDKLKVEYDLAKELWDELWLPFIKDVKDNPTKWERYDLESEFTVMFTEVYIEKYKEKNNED